MLINIMYHAIHFPYCCIEGGVTPPTLQVSDAHIGDTIRAEDNLA